MNAESKSPVTYIILIVAAIVIIGVGYAALSSNVPSKIKSTPTPTPIPEKTPEPTPKTPHKTPSPTPTPTKEVSTAPPTVTTGPSPVIKCELCHTNAKNFTPHKEGGKYCLNCHGSRVHSIHIGEGTVNLDCQTCHGFPPKIPKAEEGHVVCENCHAAPPNSLKPSYGNLIVVHLSRGKYCTNCHGSDVRGIHEEVLGTAK